MRIFPFLAFGIISAAAALAAHYQCMTCPPGTYAASGSTGACTQCPANHYCPGATNKLPCPPGADSDPGATECRITLQSLSGAECASGTLYPGTYLAVLGGGNGGKGGNGDHTGGAGGQGGRATFEFSVSSITPYTICSGQTGTDGASSYQCGSTSCGGGTSRAWCGRAGQAGEESYLMVGSKYAIAGGGGGGGGSGGYHQGNSGGPLYYCTGTVKKTGEAGITATSALGTVTILGITELTTGGSADGSSFGGAGGASCSNCNGYIGGNGSASHESNVADPDDCNSCAKLYKRN